MQERMTLVAKVRLVDCWTTIICVKSLDELARLRYELVHGHTPNMNVTASKSSLFTYSSSREVAFCRIDYVPISCYVKILIMALV